MANTSTTSFLFDTVVYLNCFVVMSLCPVTHNKGELLDKWEAEIFANIQADYLYR
uniref:Uncharacterized protein n=1 Tax=Oncorhynchus tshawytscha TaxID=74940 RepID=A0A8C8FHJ6_ONCTS